ncbi:MAG: selenide, water dikinase SelD [Bacteroidota bacterium]|jgi:selenide,water dikinase
MSSENIRLTQFSHGAGCGCKIAPKVLEEILSTQWTEPSQQLIVGNNTKDDAAVYNMNNGTALISTTDFFTPIVDDAFTFGQIAAANAISDVYAMGGNPLLAIAILGWPVDKLPATIAQKVIEGGRSICKAAGIPLAGGHSIDIPEPIFGLAVNGIVPVENIKQNSTAKEGDLIFLTKPIGVGILTTAEKKEKLQEAHIGLAAKQMIQLNSIGALLGKETAVTAITDVTGFGLGGHLVEMTNHGLTAVINWNKVPLVTDLSYYLQQRIFPDATYRNWNSYGNSIQLSKGIPVSDVFSLLPDPQTNGGLLFTVAPNQVAVIQSLLAVNGLENYCEPIGVMTAKKEKQVIIQ